MGTLSDLVEMIGSIPTSYVLLSIMFLFYVFMVGHTYYSGAEPADKAEKLLIGFVIFVISLGIDQFLFEGIANKQNYVFGMGIFPFFWARVARWIETWYDKKKEAEDEQSDNDQ